VIKVRVEEVPVNKIQVLENSRIRINQSELESLMIDMKQRGLLQPIGVLKKNNEYILRFGQRRLESAKKLKWDTIPCLVHEGTVTTEKFISDNAVENLERVNLNPAEFARVCKMLQSQKYSLGEIAVLLNKPKSRIESALNIFSRAPQEFAKDIKYIPPGIVNKKGAISATVANKILCLRVKKSEINELFVEAKQKELTAADINIIGRMIASGMTVKKAVRERNQYKIMVTHIPVRKEELAKYIKKGYRVTDLVRDFITGDVDPDPELVRM
jgi:ParB family chromosome partitioning protein